MRVKETLNTYIGRSNRASLRCVLAYRRSGADSILFKVKLFFMVFLVVVDMGLNSSVEHETFGTWDMKSRDGTVLALILG